MGVMACGRRGCEEILCTRTVLEGNRYICEGCYQELLVYKDTWALGTTIPDVRDLIEGFMDSCKGLYAPASGDDIDREFERLTS
jgi:hypothetical protein